MIKTGQTSISGVESCGASPSTEVVTGIGFVRLATPMLMPILALVDDGDEGSGDGVGDKGEGDIAAIGDGEDGTPFAWAVEFEHAFTETELEADSSTPTPTPIVELDEAAPFKLEPT